MTSITLTAPAKVNLFLKILNRRKDGYHNILTLFERISLADEVTISKAPQGITVSSDRFITAKQKDNLVYKAAELILKYKGSRRKGQGARVMGGVRIKIKKRIPIAAGLGGGSSDAAAALMGINRLYRLGLDKDELMKLGRKIGADVAFFIFGEPFAIGLGKGDILRKSPIRLKLHHLIVYPGFKVETKGVYGAYDAKMRRLTTGSSGVKISRLLGDVMDFKSVESMLTNDLEDAAVSKKAVIRGMIERLAQSLDKRAIVSGSGPSVFCLYGTGKEAMKDRRKLFDAMTAGEKKRWQVFVAGTL